MKIITLASLILALTIPKALAHEARLEGGFFQTVSNRFNIPNPGGSRVLVDKDRLQVYGRIQGLFQVSDRGFLRLVIAPLSSDYSYLPGTALSFNGKTFPAQAPVKVEYRFNSYRLGYAYRFLSSESVNFQAGLMGKVRQARIKLSGSNLSSSYDNVGFVPLLHLGLQWKVLGPWELRFDLDGAAAKQGRAFDGALEGFYNLDPSGSGLSAGIRVLEGGADNTKVNTFALLQYAFLAYTKGF